MTPHKKRIIDLLLTGLTEKAVAERLRISVDCVKAHRAQVFREYKVHSLIQLMNRLNLEKTEGSPLP